VLRFRTPLAISLPSLLFLLGLSSAGVAQLVEHLICNQRVGGSIPSASSTRNFAGGVKRSESSQSKIRGWCLLTRVLFVFSLVAETLLWKLLSGHVVSAPGVSPGCAWCVPNEFSGRVGEWLKPADCKSAAPCGLRRFESSPVHQPLVARRKPQGNRVRVDCFAITISDVLKRSVSWLPNENGAAKNNCAAKNELLTASESHVIRRGTGSAWVAQLVERVLGKDEVTGSIPVPGSSLL
jgi:hypothetical protein